MKTAYRTDWESHLVVRAQQGESIAFELLADEHRDKMCQLARRMLRNQDDANDAVQDSFVKAMGAIHTFQPGRPVLPWLLRICSNCCLDMIRQRRRTGDEIDLSSFDLADPKAVVATAVERQILGERIRGAVERLPERYSNLIMMRHFREMEVCEIASALDRPEGTIKSWLFRARALLKKELARAV